MPVVDVFAKQGKVRRVASTSSVDDVFAETRRVIEPVVKEHLLKLNQTLLDSISSGDAAAYAELCSESMTAFEGESHYNLISVRPFV